MKEKRKMGRPTGYNPAFCDRVIEFGRDGKSRCQIAACLDIPMSTLQNWEKAHKEFLVATTRARELAQAWWEDQGQKGIWGGKEFNALAYRLQVCNRFPGEWRDKQETEITGAGGESLFDSLIKAAGEIAKSKR